MDETGFARERELMVAQQLQRRGIRDPRVLEAFRAVPRHLFVGASHRGEAYADHPLPIGEGQTISQPYMVALMTQCLALRGDERVLEIGTGCGYQAAILGRLAAEVVTIERIAPLSEKAEALLGGLGYTNVRFVVGDGTRGFPPSAPYGGIVVTAGSPEIPEPLTEQLAEGGRLVIPVGGRWAQELLVVRREGGARAEQRVCGCVFVPLVGEHGWNG
jgi:protein-L-isoaspartate(D-aspartate) O-methyltransferase